MNIHLFGTVNPEFVNDEQERREAQARIDKAGRNSVDYLVHLQFLRNTADSSIGDNVDPRDL